VLHIRRLIKMKKTPKNIINSGYSLIELMVVVIIIGLIAAISFPNYSDYVTRSNRTEAMELLTEIMSAQQRYATKNRTYTVTPANIGYAAPVNTTNGFYVITFGTCGAAVSIRRCVLLTATPPVDGRQEADGVITLNSRGARQINNVDGWNQN